MSILSSIFIAMLLISVVSLQTKCEARRLCLLFEKTSTVIFGIKYIKRVAWLSRIIFLLRFQPTKAMPFTV